jgi:ubiquinone/menaquinone biosynthesis C-methylase UbiE
MRQVSDLGFDQVDRTADPTRLVSYLDAVTGIEAVRAIKRQTFALMNVRPGHAVLDVGCGAGDDLRSLAELVGPTGRVVGVDNSETMLHEASERTQGLPVECHVGDAHRLEFAADTFDGCRAERVFQHLERPTEAFAELVRVVRPGGWVVVGDPDFGTLVVDATQRNLTQRILTFRCEMVRNGWIGRQLPAFAQRCGLVDVTVHGTTPVFTDWSQADQVIGLQRAAELAASKGVISTAEAGAWIRDLEQRAAAGRFFSAITAFLVGGRKP